MATTTSPTRTTTPTTGPTGRLSQPGRPHALRWVGAGLIVLAVIAAILVLSHRSTPIPAKAAPVGATVVGAQVGGQRTGADAERHLYGARALVDAQGTPVVSAPTGSTPTRSGADPERHFFESRGGQ